MRLFILVSCLRIIANSSIFSFVAWCSLAIDDGPKHLRVPFSNNYCFILSLATQLREFLTATSGHVALAIKENVS